MHVTALTMQLAATHHAEKRRRKRAHEQEQIKAHNAVSQQHNTPY